MACNVHITLCWGRARNQHACQRFSNKLITPTFLAIDKYLISETLVGVIRILIKRRKREAGVY